MSATQTPHARPPISRKNIASFRRMSKEEKKSCVLAEIMALLIVMATAYGVTKLAFEIMRGAQ
jgi:hypothetical protein